MRRRMLQNQIVYLCRKVIQYSLFYSSYFEFFLAVSIANYINTVENSRAPDLQTAVTNTNPYAMAYPAVPMSAATSATQPAAEHPQATSGNATPILCAKCAIEKPKGKMSKYLHKTFCSFR